MTQNDMVVFFINPNAEGAYDAGPNLEGFVRVAVTAEIDCHLLLPSIPAWNFVRFFSFRR